MPSTATQPLAEQYNKSGRQPGLAFAATGAPLLDSRGREPAQPTITEPTQGDRTCAEAASVRSQGASRMAADAAHARAK